MKLIFGLGNIGDEYKWTRHNVGFETINKLAYDYNIKINKNKNKSIYGEGIIHGEKAILIKPLTYMNLSGDCVLSFFNFYKDIELKDIIVVCDDINIDIGTIRIRAKGSAGGQNGLKDIIKKLGDDSFPRLRIGISNNPNIPLANYVLSKFAKDEESDIINGITNATNALSLFIKDGEKGLIKAMDNYNKKAIKKIDKKEILDR